MRILSSIRCTFRAARFASFARSKLAPSSRPSATRTCSLFRLRELPIFSASSVQLAFFKNFLSTTMGAGGSKKGEGEGEKKKKSTKKGEKETAAIATPAQQQAAEGAKESVAAAAEVEYVECAVAKASEFGENEMKEVEVEEKKVLVVHQNGAWSALGAKCTHYGAPLIKGCLGNGRVRCPWHGACFNTTSGDIEDFPGLDSLPLFQVRVEGDDVIVKADKALLGNTRRTKQSVVASVEEDKRTFLIIGGGAYDQ
jgi:nitrite reductase/ring-hydroxylating ferredoxin subunit